MPKKGPASLKEIACSKCGKKVYVPRYQTGKVRCGHCREGIKAR